MKIELALSALKSSKKFTFVFILNFCLGITGIFALEYFKGLIDKSMEREAKSLLGADLVVSSRFPIEEKVKNSIIEKLPEIKKFSEGISLFTMISSDKRGRLAQAVKVEKGYPFFGGFLFDDQSVFPSEKALPSKDEVWVYPEVLTQLEVEKGGSIEIGNAKFKVAGVIADDSLKTIRFSGFMPRVYMTQEAIERAGLIQFGTTANYSFHFLFDRYYSNDELEEIEEELEESIQGSIRVASPNDGSDRVARILQLMADFLSLVSLVTLFLSFVGLFYLYSGFLLKYKKDMMILLDLGVRKSKVIAIYLFHFSFMLAIAGFLVFALVNLLAPWAKEIIASTLDMNLIFKVDALFYIKALFFLVLIVPAVALPMLLQNLAGKFKPSLKNVLPYFPLLLLFLGLSMYVSESEKVGLFFCLGVFAAASLSLGAGYFALNFLDYSGLGPKVAKTLAFKNVTRRKSSTLIIAISLFLCSALFSLIPQISSSLSESLSLAKEEKPALFLLDIQENQIKELKPVMKEQEAELQNISAMVRARVISLNGKDFKNDDTKSADEDEEELRNRAVNLTYRKALYPSEEIVEGSPFSGTYQSEDFSTPVEISVEKRYADRRDIEVGDKLVFDILGMEVPGQVVNIRTVKWTDFVPNFFFLLQDGALNDAPKTFLATVSGKDIDSNSIILSLAEKFPNVSVIDVRRVIDKILSIVGIVNSVLNKMGVFSIIIGLLLIFIIIQHQMAIRREDIIRLKMIGVKLGQIRRSLLIEFGFIAFISAFSGLAVGMLGSWILAQFIFEGRWSPQWELALLIGILTPLLILLVVATFGYFATMRQEADLFGESSEN